MSMKKKIGPKPNRKLSTEEQELHRLFIEYLKKQEQIEPIIHLAMERRPSSPRRYLKSDSDGEEAEDSRASKEKG